MDTPEPNRSIARTQLARTFACTNVPAGFQHTWVRFDGDWDRSYGFWPDGSNLLGPFDPFHPGYLRTNDHTDEDADCGAVAPVCVETSAAENDILESGIWDEFSEKPYFFGISDCRDLPEYMVETLTELRGSELPFYTCDPSMNSCP